MISKIFKESDIKELKSLIENAGRIVLTCHVRPDGDAIGSTLGFAKVLESIGKEAVVVMPDEAPRSLSWMPGFKELVPYSKYPDYARSLLDSADLLICCDFNTLTRLDSFKDAISECNCKKVLVDHHQFPDSFCDLTFSFPDMSSTCELVFRLVAALGLYPEMTRDAATCICTGLITDTRNFSVNCSDPEIYLVLMKLLDKGVNKTRIVKEALETSTLDAMRLQAYAVSEKLELFESELLAITTLDKEELDKYHYAKGDTEGLVNEPLKIKGVVASFFLREDPDCIKVSARSVGNFPVSDVCSDLYSGGGHIQASGGEYHGTMRQCRKVLIDSIPKYAAKLRKARKELDKPI